MKQKKKEIRNKRTWIGLILILLCTLAMSIQTFAANTSMKNKKWVTGQGGAYIDTDKDGKKDTFQSAGKTYYKIQIPKQGYIVVDVKTSQLPGEQEYNDYMNEDGDWDEESDTSTTLELLNSKKKLLGKYDNYLPKKNGFTFTAIVKKGTYYLTAEGEQKYKIRYIFTSVPKGSKAGKNSKSAVTLKKGVTVKNLISNDKYHYDTVKFLIISKIPLKH